MMFDNDLGKPMFSRPLKGDLKIKKGKYYTGIVEKIVYGGKGIVKIEDFVVFVEKAITGQEIEFQISKLKKSYAQGKLVRVIKKAKNEIEAKCNHFGDCGGCKWQNLPYEAQLSIKSEIVRENIESVVNAESYEFEKIVPSPQGWNYRNKLDFSYGYQVMEVETTEEGERIYRDLYPCLGFHRPKKFELIIPIENCEIAPVEANQILRIMQKFREKHDFSVHNPKTHKGFMRNVIVRKGERMGEVLVNVVVNWEDAYKMGQIRDDKLEMINCSETPSRGQGGVVSKVLECNQLNQAQNEKVQLGEIEPAANRMDSRLRGNDRCEGGNDRCEGGNDRCEGGNDKCGGGSDKCGNGDDMNIWQELVEEIKQIKGIVGILLTFNKSWNDAVMDGYTDILWGRDYLYDKIGDLKFKISPEAFFQTNTLGAKELYDTAKEFAGLSGKEKVLDLYCGTGTIGLYLADQAQQVYGIELVAPAIENAKVNAELNGIENAEFICGNIDKSLHDLLEKVDSQIDVVILDPPRVGVGKKALKRVLEINAKKIVYVSCNPTTFARDLEVLSENGYKLIKVRTVDMFPHTHHIEMVASLELASS